MVKELTAIFDRIGRAEEHLEVIQGKLLDYYRADKCVVTGEYKPKADGLYGTIEDDVIDTPPIDPRLNTIIVVFLHDLRSSLDHRAWQLVLHAHGTPTRKTSFPICAVPAANEKGEWVGPNVAGGISTDAEALIDGRSPISGGRLAASTRSGCCTSSGTSTSTDTSSRKAPALRSLSPSGCRASGSALDLSQPPKPAHVSVSSPTIPPWTWTHTRPWR